MGIQELCLAAPAQKAEELVEAAGTELQPEKDVETC